MIRIDAANIKGREFVAAKPKATRIGNNRYGSAHDIARKRQLPHRQLYAVCPVAAQAAGDTTNLTMQAGASTLHTGK